MAAEHICPTMFSNAHPQWYQRIDLRTQPYDS